MLLRGRGAAELYMVYSGTSFRTGDDCPTSCRCDDENDAASCCISWEISGQAQYHCNGLKDERFAYFNGAKRLRAGAEAAALQITGRDLWAPDEDGRCHSHPHVRGPMMRAGYAATRHQWGDRAQFSGVARNVSTLDYLKFYDPVARPWFSAALDGYPDNRWAPVYLFSFDDTIDKRPLGLTATRIMVNSTIQHFDPSVIPSGSAGAGAMNSTVWVDACDFKLTGISSLLSTIEFGDKIEGEEITNGAAHADAAAAATNCDRNPRALGRLRRDGGRP